MTSASHSSENRPVDAGENEMDMTVASAEWVDGWNEAEPATTNLVRHGDFPAADQMQVIIGPDAIAQIEAHSQSDLSVELGGVLIGRAFQYQGRRYVEVTAALPAHSQENSAVHFTFTADAWARIHKDRDALYPEQQIVGWFHTHPDLGVFYSSDDVVVHTVAFNLPWHVGLVVDPVQNEASFFGWTKQAPGVTSNTPAAAPGDVANTASAQIAPPGTGSALFLAPIAGFFEMVGTDEDPILPWQPAFRPAVWDHNPYVRTDIEGSSSWLSGTGPLLPPVSAWWGVGLASGLFFALLLVILFGVVPARRQTQQLAAVVTGLGQVQLATAESSGTANCPDERLQILAPLAGGSVNAGTTVAIIGRAEHPDADRYQVLVKPAGAETWTLLNEFRRDQRFGQLATWPAEMASGSFELSLLALDREALPLNERAICQIRVDVN